MPLKTLKTINFDKKSVFLRADLNVPLKNNLILDDYRLMAILPTIDYILQNNGKIILATHLGRPKGHRDESLSTTILIPWFKEHGYDIAFVQDPSHIASLPQGYPHKLLLLENLRFFPEEKEGSSAFAQKLASLADIYINDAFGVMHRTDTSVTLLPEHFDAGNRGIGLLVEQEIATLNNLKIKPVQPFVLVLGGSKLTDKIAMIKQLLQASEEQRVKTILVGGLIAQAFLRAQGFTTGVTPIDETTIKTAQSILTMANTVGVTIMLPTDAYLGIAHDQRSRPLAIDQIPNNGNIVDIGPKTIEAFSHMLAQAKTIFANGTMGIYENAAYAEGTKKVFQAIAQSSAFSVIGGGDATAAAHLFGVTDAIDFCSTGGGATLAFLGAHDPFKELPGLKALAQ